MPTTTQQAELRKEIDDLKIQIVDFTKRRDELSTELQKANDEIVSLNKQLGEALFESKDVSKIYQAMMIEKSKADGLREAVPLAEKKLADLRNQLAETIDAFIDIDVKRLASETKGMFDTCLNGLYEALADFEVIEEKIKEVASVAGVSISKLENKYKFIREMRTIRKRIRGGVPGDWGEPGLYELLRNVERYFPKTVADARGTKKLASGLVSIPSLEIDTRKSKFPSLDMIDLKTGIITPHLETTQLAEVGTRKPKKSGVHPLA